MPNICSNFLKLTGNSQQLQQFAARCIVDETFDPELIVPSDEDGNANWGTRWIECFSVSVTDTQIVISFDSAWSPPEELCRKMSVIYDQIVFKLLFDEPGCDFGGLIVYLNDDCIFHEVDSLDPQYDGISMMRLNDQWVFANTQTIPEDITQEDIEDDIQFVNRFDIESYDESDDIAQFIVQQPQIQYVIPYTIIGDNFAGSLELEEITCSVCLNEPSNPQIAVCNHMFCETCIQTWIDTRLQQYQRPQCPYCRSNL